MPTDSAPFLTNATVASAEIGYWPFAATAWVAVGDPGADVTAATSLHADLDANGEAWPCGTRAWPANSSSPSPRRGPSSPENPAAPE